MSVESAPPVGEEKEEEVEEMEKEEKEEDTPDDTTHSVGAEGSGSVPFSGYYIDLNPFNMSILMSKLLFNGL